MKKLSPRKMTALQSLILAGGREFSEMTTMANNSRQKIVDVLEANPNGLDFYVICTEAGLSMTTAGREMQKMIDAGEIERCGPNKIQWRLVDDNEQ